MAKRQPKYRDFSEMPDEVLRRFADALADPKTALKRIRAEKRAARILQKAG